MIEMAAKQYIPAIIKYTTSLANSVNEIKSACPEAVVSVQTELLKKCSALLAQAQSALNTSIDVTNKGCDMEEGKEQAEYYRDTVFTSMAELRTPIDELEMLVDKEYWPVPSYGDLIFEV